MSSVRRGPADEGEGAAIPRRLGAPVGAPGACAGRRRPDGTSKTPPGSLSRPPPSGAAASAGRYIRAGDASLRERTMGIRSLHRRAVGRDRHMPASLRAVTSLVCMRVRRHGRKGSFSGRFIPGASQCEARKSGYWCEHQDAVGRARRRCDRQTIDFAGRVDRCGGRIRTELEVEPRKNRSNRASQSSTQLCPTARHFNHARPPQHGEFVIPAG